MSESKASVFDHPIELEKYGPRAVRRTAWGNALFYGLRLLLGVVLLGGYALMRRDLRHLEILREDGLVVNGVVTDKREYHGKSNSYELDYQFTVAKREFSDRQFVSWYEYLAVYEGAPYPVTYLPSDPNIHIVGYVTDELQTGRMWNWIAATVYLGLTVTICCAIGDFNIRLQARILRDYIAVPGVIDTVAREEEGRTSMYVARFRYRSPKDGSELKGLTKRGSEFREFSIGDPATVLVPPEVGNPHLYRLIRLAEIAD